MSQQRIEELESELQRMTHDLQHAETLIARYRQELSALQVVNIEQRIILDEVRAESEAQMNLIYKLLTDKKHER